MARLEEQRHSQPAIPEHLTPEEAPRPVSEGLSARYRAVRADTEALTKPLSAEDQTVQSMPDASPAKWHRAHTTWFFETFVLKRFAVRYRAFHPCYGYLFNSYYEAAGPRHARPRRGLVTRPSAEEIGRYRAHVDAAMLALIREATLAEEPKIAALIELGLHHEQQHQELLLSDILHAFAQNPLDPAYTSYVPAVVRASAPMGMIPYEGGIAAIGHDGEGFAFDNEGPRHQVLLQPYSLADRLVTNGEWLEFIADGGYAKPALWLSDGWQTCQAEGWQAPLYWRNDDGQWTTMTLSGRRALDFDAPVTHISYYEADAFSRWRGTRLPTEAEWEAAAAQADRGQANLHGSGYLRPRKAPQWGRAPRQMFGDVWEWTQSPYAPYPGYVTPRGVAGEYNGKFMANQFVLKGGSCVTPDDHIRASYRNFFYPHQRWQFTGLRLAADARKPRPTSWQSEEDALKRDVWGGLAQDQKRLPSKYLYDREGSRLFDAICDEPEYYLTRTEIALLGSLAPALARMMPTDSALVEFGSGSSVKTRILLDTMPAITAYVPVDISAAHLKAIAEGVAQRYPDCAVYPVAADFTGDFALPAALAGRPLLGFFPGSTIGNFAPSEAQALLGTMRRILGDDATLLMGYDLVKPVETLIAAYDDARGTTAAFEKNVLARINRALDADFDLTAFSYCAEWDEAAQCVAMYLVSDKDQSVEIAGRRFDFAAGETVHTENSHKFTLSGFRALALSSGWRVTREWTSAGNTFGVALLG